MVPNMSTASFLLVIFGFLMLIALLHVESGARGTGAPTARRKRAEGAAAPVPRTEAETQ